MDYYVNEEKEAEGNKEAKGVHDMWGGEERGREVGR